MVERKRSKAMQVAIATDLLHDVLKVTPFVPIILLWIGAFIRDRSIFF
jgi:hypothetical protein